MKKSLKIIDILSKISLSVTSYSLILKLLLLGFGIYGFSFLIPLFSFLSYSAFEVSKVIIENAGKTREDILKEKINQAMEYAQKEFAKSDEAKKLWEWEEKLERQKPYREDFIYDAEYSIDEADKGEKNEDTSIYGLAINRLKEVKSGILLDSEKKYK